MSDHPEVLSSVYGEEEQQAVNDVLASGELVAYGEGEHIPAFEEEISTLFGKDHGVMVNSGSSANLLAVKAADLPAGSEVITPAVTFITTVAPIIQSDLVPVFTDVGIGDYQVDVDQVEEAITEDTEAILVPNLLGNIPDWPRLKELADDHDLTLIEDSCDTVAGTIDGNVTGSYTDITTTSFYEHHLITAMGAGGMVMVDDEAYRDRAKIFRAWGRISAIEESEEFEKRWSRDIDGIPYDSRFIFTELGYNFLPTEAQAAFGRAQIEKLDRFAQRRRAVFDEFDSFFQNYSDYFITPESLDTVNTTWLVFPLTITEDAPFERNDLIEHLWSADIEVRPLFSGNILRHPAFQEIEKRTAVDEFTNAEYITRNSIRIGCHQAMDEAEVNHIKEKATEFLSQY